MTRIVALSLAALVALTPATAQELEQTPKAEDGMREGLDLLGEGMRLFFEGLGDEIEPKMKELAEAMEPAFAKLLELMDDIDAYQMPEILPNGDIIIRRKTPLKPEDAPEDGEIEI